MTQTVAIIGASADRTKFGNKSVRAHQRAGYTVYPIHPSETSIEGLQVYRSMDDVPAVHIDRVSLYVPPKVALTVLDTLVGRSIGEIWLNPGVDSHDVMTRAQELGLPVVASCSIVALGMSPGEFPA